MAFGDRIKAVMESDRAVANGVATLNANKKLVQMPTYSDVGVGNPDASNQNLLDNPWFTVNQRGATSATNNYGFDRWYGNSYTISGATATIPAGKIMIQPLEPILRTVMTGTKVTATVHYSTGVTDTGTITFQNATSQQSIFTKGRIYALFNEQQAFALYNPTSSDITIDAVKLELGTVSTLQYDAPPIYSQELAKCQRYFQRIGGTGNVLFANGYAYNTTTAQMSFPVVPKRSTITAQTGSVRAELSGTVALWQGTSVGTNGKKATTILSIGVNAGQSLGYIALTADDALTTGSALIGQLRDGAYIDIICDIT